MGKGARNSIELPAAGDALRQRRKQPRSPSVDSSSDTVDVSRVPSEKPTFTVKDLRNAIPKHCFDRSLVKSFSYLIADLIGASLLLASTTQAHRLPTWAQFVFWPVYWYLQGAVCTGLWVIAHECGHQAFSKYGVVNDSVGWVVHSALLVPYFSWKYSHARHHKNTGSIAKDEVFVPPSEAEVQDVKEGDFILYNTVFYRIGLVLVTLLLGWPLYLLFNASGRPYPRWASHFDPTSPIFTERQRAFVLLSDVGMAIAMGALYKLAQMYSFKTLMMCYGVPYLIVNAWLVTITLLQHTHVKLPHYTDSEWDWLRGALATVDRNYGWLLNTLHHHIADTHVCHHLFSEIPHYHAEEATKALKKVLGPYYLYDNRNIFKALWDDLRECRYVAPDTKGSGILWYRR